MHKLAVYGHNWVGRIIPDHFTQLLANHFRDHDVVSFAILVVPDPMTSGASLIGGLWGGIYRPATKIWGTLEPDVKGDLGVYPKLLYFRVCKNFTRFIKKRRR